MKIKTYNTKPRDCYLRGITILFEKVYNENIFNIHARFYKCISEGYSLDLLLEEGEVLGLCLYKKDCNMHTGDILRIDTLVVKEQGLGYGSKLLDKFKLGTIQLECHVDNVEGQRFYEARNFKRRAYSYVR